MGKGKGSLKYFPTTAQKKYDTRRLKSHRPCEYTCENTQYVAEKIKGHGLPKQIANRATEENEKVPSAATIYRMIHKSPKTAINGKNYGLGKMRKSRYCIALKVKDKKAKNSSRSNMSNERPSS